MPTEHNQAEHTVLGAIPANDKPAASGAATAAAGAQPSAPPAPNRRVIIIAGVIAVLALGVGLHMWYRSYYFVETDNAYVAGHVHPVSARIAGVVTKVYIDDNQLVKEGDVIADLDPFDQHAAADKIAAQIVTAQQQVLQAEAQIAQAKAQAGAAAAMVAQSAAQLLRAEQDAERYGQLYTSQMKAVSKAELDAANAARSAAVADVASRRDAASAAGAQIQVATAARDVLKAQAEVLQVELKAAQQQVNYNHVLAPVSGRVGKRAVEVGMRVQPGQQMTVIVEENVWISANYKETQLADLRLGQKVNVTIDAMPGKKLVGTIESFAPASGAQFALLPADNATGNFTKIVQRVPVKIVFTAADIAALGGRLVPGMSAETNVEINQSLPAHSAAH